MPSSNPIQVKVYLETPMNVYFAATTYSGWTQIVTVTPPGGAPLTQQGHGEGTLIGQSPYWLPAGPSTFEVHFQYDNGSGPQDSIMVQQASFAVGTLNQIVVFSEDGADEDDNDCIVTFTWFTPTSGAAAA
jgi:hypothetical protein